MWVILSAVGGAVFLQYGESCYLHNVHESQVGAPTSFPQQRSGQWARDTGIFRVVTVVYVPGYMGALLQGRLCTGALEIVQQDCPCAGPEEGFPPSHHGLSTAHLVTHNLCVREVPGVIAHCPPTRIGEHLHPTLTLVLAIHQSHRSFNEKEKSHTNSLKGGWVDFVLIQDTLNLPSEGCAVEVAAVLSVTLKSRPFTKWFAKAKSNRGQQKNTVMPVGSGNTHSGSITWHSLLPCGSIQEASRWAPLGPQYRDTLCSLLAVIRLLNMFL